MEGFLKTRTKYLPICLTAFDVHLLCADIALGTRGAEAGKVDKMAPFSWSCHSSEGRRPKENLHVVSLYCVSIILTQILPFLDMVPSIMGTAAGNSTTTNGK